MGILMKNLKVCRGRVACLDAMDIYANLNPDKLVHATNALGYDAYSWY